MGGEGKRKKKQIWKIYFHLRQTCMIYSICSFEWNNHFKEARRRNTIRPNCVLRPPSKTSSPTMPGKRLVQMYSVVTVSVCGGRRVGMALLGWCIIFCLLFVLLFIDRLIVTLDMSGVMEDLGTKTQVAAPRHCLTSQTGELIKHDQYWSPPPLPFIHLFIFFRLGLKKNVCHQKLKRQTSSLHSSYFSINLVFVDSYSSV